MTFKEFRLSRMLSQVELAMLLAVTRDWVRGRDRKPINEYWTRTIDDMLEMGPHDYIKRRLFFPPKEGVQPKRSLLTVAIKRRLPLGSCYLALEYFQPDTLEIAQSRKDLLAFAKKYPAERLFILRRIIARGKAGEQVIAVYKPKWPPPRFDK